MFSGIVETVGSILEVKSIPGGSDLLISAPEWTAGLALGESVSVSGVCLTVTGAAPGGFRTQAIRETLSRTTLGGASAGSRVNLERALRPSDRIGGHFVSGHVDETARVLEVADLGAEWRVRVETPRRLALHLVEKGSVAIDGVSLTVAEVGAEDFTVCLIPFTRERTTLGGAAAGTRINLETDLIGKYAARVLAEYAAGSAPGARAPRGSLR